MSSVLMKGITWARDSHGLFDYESRHLTKNTMKTHQAGTICRKNNDIELKPVIKKSSEASSEAKPLLSIINENGKYSTKFWANCRKFFFVQSLDSSIRSRDAEHSVWFAKNCWCAAMGLRCLFFQNFKFNRSLIYTCYRPVFPRISHRFQ